MKKEDLIKGKYYKGIGRFIGDIALWDGQEFIGFQVKYNEYQETWANFGPQGFTPTEELK